MKLRGLNCTKKKFKMGQILLIIVAVIFILGALSGYMVRDSLEDE